MAQINTVRPLSVHTGANWTAIPSGTLASVTSDNNPTTVAFNSTTDPHTAMILLTGNHTIPSGYERHRFRFRGSIASSDLSSANGSVAVGPSGTNYSGYYTENHGTLTSFSSVTFTGGWNYNAPWTRNPSPVDFMVGMAAGADNGRSVWELYVDVDCRKTPDFTAVVRDSAGVARNGQTITDTNTPIFEFGTVDYDGLNSTSWEYTLTGPVSYSASGSGHPPAQITAPTPLVDGSYTLVFTARSSIRLTDTATGTDTVTFSISYVSPSVPSNITAIPDGIDVDVCWDGGVGEGAWDAGVVTEIRRIDCQGTVSLVSLSDATTDCYTDVTAPITNPNNLCGGTTTDCEVVYELRFVGTQSGKPVTTAWMPSDPVVVYNPTLGNDWLRGTTSVSICPDRTYTRNRVFGRYQPIGGGIPTVHNSHPSLRNYTLRIPVANQDDYDALMAVLAEPTLLYVPSDAASVWQKPNTETIEVTKVGRIRVVTVSMMGVNP